MQEKYDHIIIGAGAAGLQLVLAMLRDPYFSEDTILILDPDKKNKNDKTWSFWQKEEGPLESLVYKTWTKGSFNSNNLALNLDLGPYTYNMIRSIDFYDYAREEISKHARVQWSQERVDNVKQDVVESNGNSYQGRFIYDSRIPTSFHEDKKSVKLLQHFLGWIIKVEEPLFDRDNFTMMDFRSNDARACSFTYILPFDEHTALVEFTLFSPTLLEENEYSGFLKSYIEKILNQSDYEVIEKEEGIIPMSDFDFTRDNSSGYMRIGTAGGWVKPSTGYSFKASGEYVEKTLSHLKDNNALPKSIHRNRSRFFDSLFLGVLKEDNASGVKFFENMYRKLSAQTILKFLEEKTSLAEDLKVLSKFATRSFTKALIKANLKF